MKNFKKILACVMALGTLCTVGSISVSADIIDSDGSTVETIDIWDYPDDYTLGEETEIELSTGETITLPSWTVKLHDLDGNVYAYEMCEWDEIQQCWICDYILIDGNRRIPGFPVFDTNKNYIGCVETINYNYPIKIDGTDYTLPNGQDVNLKPCVNNQNANAQLRIWYDDNDTYDGYEIITVLYSFNRKKGDCYALPNGDELEISTNAIAIRYNADGEYVGYTLHSYSEPAIPVDDIIDDSESTSITEFTVGESTFPRGDINLDGTVNTVDLLMLKKYLLGLMEW